MPVHHDQLGREIHVSDKPQRIVSLVPSQTELLYDLGLAGEVVGITKFCVHPDGWFRSKKRIGGTKQLHLDEIRALKPDLIIANKEENVREQVEALAEDFPVWISDVNNLEDAYAMISGVGALTGKNVEAAAMVEDIRKAFSRLNLKHSHAPAHLRVAYLIWKDPYMAAGGDTFIHDMLQHAGLVNVFADQKRYPQTSVEELRSLRCDLILLSSEPYPFSEKHRAEWQHEWPGCRTVLVDGEMFSWYGSRLRLAADYFAGLRQVASFS